MKHKDLKLTFDAGKVTLLTGESESGKSSIVYAFFWCLYGKVSKVYRGDSGKVSVQINIDDLIIYRQARPGKLIVTNIETQHKYAGSVAQAIINQKFGTKDIWLSSSLLQQKKTSYIMETKNSNKMNILQELTFDQDVPDEYIQQIQKYIDHQKLEYDKLMAQYEVHAENHLKLYDNNNKPSKTKKELETELKNKKSELEDLKIKLLESKEKLNVYSEGVIKLNIFTKDLEQHKQKKIENVDITLINKLESEIDSLKKDLILNEHKKSKVQEYNELKRKIDELKPKISSFGTYDANNEIYLNVRDTERNYKRNKDLAVKLGYKYESDTIMSDIQKYKLCLSEYTKIKDSISILSKYQKLTGQLPEFMPLEVTSEQVKTQKDVYDQMEKNVKLLECPHCLKPLKYNKGLLVKAEDGVSIITKDQLTEQRNITQRIYDGYKDYTKYKDLKDKIDRLKVKLVDIDTIKKYQNFEFGKVLSKITKLESIEFYSQPKIPSNIIKAKIEIDTIESKMKKLDINLNSGTTPLETTDLKNDIKLKQSRWKELKQKKFDYEQVSHTIEKLEQTIKVLSLNLDDVVVDQNNQLQTKIEILTENVDFLGKEVNKCTSWAELSEHKLSIDKIDDEMRVTHNIKEKSINLNCKLLDDTVNTINMISSGILKSIFDKSVMLDIKLFKKLKVGKITKQIVNLNIYFDANKHEKRLCGGEEDRISLALLLSINQLSNSPFILIDEKMGTVSPRIAKKCFKSIKEYTTNDKYAICVEHNVVKGMYDSVIDLNKL